MVLRVRTRQAPKAGIPMLRSSSVGPLGGTVTKVVSKYAIHMSVE